MEDSKLILLVQDLPIHNHQDILRPIKKLVTLYQNAFAPQI